MGRMVSGCPNPAFVSSTNTKTKEESFFRLRYDTPTGKPVFFARADTGASLCIFQRMHAETVGIAVESGVPTRISTVTGAFLAYAHRVALGVLGLEVESTVYFAESPAMPRDVLGQTGWLDRMRLALVDHDSPPVSEPL